MSNWWHFLMNVSLHYLKLPSFSNYDVLSLVRPWFLKSLWHITTVCCHMMFNLVSRNDTDISRSVLRNLWELVTKKTCTIAQSRSVSYNLSEFNGDVEDSSMRGSCWRNVHFHQGCFTHCLSFISASIGFPWMSRKKINKRSIQLTHELTWFTHSSTNEGWQGGSVVVRTWWLAERGGGRTVKIYFLNSLCSLTVPLHT